MDSQSSSTISSSVSSISSISNVSNPDSQNVSSANATNLNKLSILHINVQSLRNKIPELMLESEGYDILALSETWLHGGILDNNLQLPDFQPILRKDRPNDPWGGVAIYARNNIAVNRRQDLEEPTLELLWCEVTFHNTRILLGATYRPPNSPAETWLNLEANIAEAKSSGIPHTMIIGDLNCNMLQPNNKCQKMLDNLHMEQLIKDPTHTTDNNATLLDIIATNSYDLVESTQVRNPSLSNHTNIHVILNIDKPHIKSHSRTIYDCPRLRACQLERSQN